MTATAQALEPRGPVPGPFAQAALDLGSYGLAVIPVGGDDGKVPLLSWANWRRPPGRKFLAKLMRRYDRANIGIICDLSGVTVVDVDDANIVDAMVQRFGETPLKTRTPSGGTHLWYSNNGERCANLRSSQGLSVDVKGIGGFVVVPPSIRPSGRHAGKPYTFLCGSWDDLARLPKMRSVLAERRPDPAQAETTALATRLRAVRTGVRNDFLFRSLLREVKACGDLEALRDVARSINARFEERLPDPEVDKTARSVWQMEKEGRNWAGEKGKIVFDAIEYEVLLESPNALALYAVLKANHGARSEAFALSPKAMAEADVVPGWGPRRYARARDWLVDRGFLMVIHKGGRGPGDVRRFKFSSLSSKRVPKPHAI